MIRLVKTVDDTLILFLGRKRRHFKLLYIIEDGQEPTCVWTTSGRHLSSAAEFSIGVRSEEDYEFVKETFKEIPIIGESLNPDWYEPDIDNTWDIDSKGYVTDLICHAHFYGLAYKKRLTFWAALYTTNALEIIGELRKKNYLIIWRPSVPGVGRNLILG